MDQSWAPHRIRKSVSTRNVLRWPWSSRTFKPTSFVNRKFRSSRKRDLNEKERLYDKKNQTPLASIQERGDATRNFGNWFSKPTKALSRKRGVWIVVQWRELTESVNYTFNCSAMNRSHLIAHQYQQLQSQQEQQPQMQAWEQQPVHARIMAKNFSHSSSSPSKFDNTSFSGSRLQSLRPRPLYIRESSWGSASTWLLGSAEARFTLTLNSNNLPSPYHRWGLRDLQCRVPVQEITLRKLELRWKRWCRNTKQIFVVKEVNKTAFSSFHPVASSLK